MSEFERIIAIDGIPEVVEDDQPAKLTPFDMFCARIREIYCIFRRQKPGCETYGAKPIPQWDGGEASDGRKCQNIWPKVAHAILSCEADPLDYIGAQFALFPAGRVPQPNQLYGDKAVGRWRQRSHDAGESIERKITADLRRLKSYIVPFVRNLGWTRERAVRKAIQSRDSGISPLTKYCVANHEGLPTTSELRDAALSQYVFHLSHYDRVLGQQIPVELKEEALALRRELIGN